MLSPSPAKGFPPAPPAPPNPAKGFPPGGPPAPPSPANGFPPGPPIPYIMFIALFINSGSDNLYIIAGSFKADIISGFY
jgi:hypothetical protein